MHRKVIFWIDPESINGKTVRSDTGKDGDRIFSKRRNQENKETFYRNGNSAAILKTEYRLICDNTEILSGHGNSIWL